MEQVRVVIRPACVLCDIRLAFVMRMENYAVKLRAKHAMVTQERAPRFSLIHSHQPSFKAAAAAVTGMSYIP